MCAKPVWITALAAMAVPFLAAPAAARDEAQTIRAAHDVLQQFLDLKVRQIPESLLAQAHGVAIIPGVIKLGLVVGGQRGKGVVIVREPDGSWRGPLFVTITGGSIGWQVGAQSTDFVLVFKSPQSVQGLLKGKFTLGADASIAAGPVGRRAGAATDIELRAEIYSYSRSRGLFAGVSLDGSALSVDDEANAAYYGAVGPGGAAAPPQEAMALVQLVAAATSGAAAAPDALAPQPADPQPVLAAPLNQAAPHADALRDELARSAARLQPLLDESWQRYLALPAEIYQRGGHPSRVALEAVLARFAQVASDPQYRNLAQRGEFQATYGVIRAYAAALAADGPARLSLPPPPGAERR